MKCIIQKITPFFFAFSIAFMLLNVQVRADVPYDEMTREEKIAFWNDTVQVNDGDGSTHYEHNWEQYFDYNTGLEWSYRSSGQNYLHPSWGETNPDYASPAEFLADNVTFNSSTDEYENSEALQVVINNAIQAYPEQATYTQGYMPGAAMLDPSPFEHASVYKFIKNTIANNPDFYFFIERNIYNGGYLLTACNLDPLGGVSAKQNWRNSRINSAIYNDDWNQNFEKDPAGNWAVCCISAENIGTSHITFTYCEGTGGPYSAWQFSSEQTATTAGVDMSDYLNPEITNENLQTINPTYGNASRFAGYSLYRSTSTIQSEYSAGTLGFGGSGICWHGSGNYWALDIYNTVGDLKRGNVGVKQASYLPNYTGTAPAAVSSSYGNILNNYISSGGTGTGTGGSGSGSGSDDDDNGSGSGWLDKIISGLGSVGEALLSIVGVILEWVGKAIDFVKGTLDDVIELVTGNKFIEVLEAFFPFVPTEIWTGMSLIIGMILFRSIINFLRR